jgi:hypothetical protein
VFRRELTAHVGNVPGASLACLLAFFLSSRLWCYLQFQTFIHEVFCAPSLGFSAYRLVFSKLSFALLWQWLKRSTAWREFQNNLTRKSSGTTKLKERKRKKMAMSQSSSMTIFSPKYRKPVVCNTLC